MAEPTESKAVATIDDVLTGLAILSSFASNLATVASAIQSNQASGRDFTPEEIAAAQAVTKMKRDAALAT